jgi:type IV secretion system protein VirB3
MPQRFQPEPFPLFKGATRVPTVLGVPLVPLLIMVIAIAAVAMTLSLWWWLIALPLWLIMAQVTKNDDRAFRIWWLFIDTKWRNSSNSFWQASTYSKINYHRDRK